jgi:hypothetical protein
MEILKFFNNFGAVKDWPNFKVCVKNWIKHHEFGKIRFFCKNVVRAGFVEHPSLT